MKTAGEGNYNAVKRYLMCGEDVDSVDHSGCTPLYAAAVGNHHEVVELLIKAGANVNIRDKNVGNHITIVVNIKYTCW